MDKYYLYKYNKVIKKVISGSNKKILQQLDLKDNKKYEYILLTLSKIKDYNKESKFIGGPIKITFKILETKTNRKGNVILVPKYEKQLNRKGEKDYDKRNAQFLYLTTEYLKKFNKKDIKLVAELAIQNKLEKRLLAPKLIDQIYNLKKINK